MRVSVPSEEPLELLTVYGTALSHSPSMAHHCFERSLLSNRQFSTSCCDSPLALRDATPWGSKGLPRATFKMTEAIVLFERVGRNYGGKGQIVPARKIASGC